ncbi:unnamed protein product [Moneuplotes crassus]|uniref:S1-like domain-containing protein n=1 Tax=Euplotes crassus TaxID=5936 RepID=A0AAD1XYG4_EUPCR|nr:unnamed protein product [Moneuplotes crassus]
MPRGAGKGGNKRKKNKNKNFQSRRPLELKEEGQDYGIVTKMLGNSRIECVCGDGKTRICLIRGKMKNRVWIRAGDVVLVSLREFEDDKGDIILKYHPEEFRELKKKGEIPETLKVDVDEAGEEEDDVNFEEVEVAPQRKILMPDSDDEDEDEEEKKEIDVDDI